MSGRSIKPEKRIPVFVGPSFILYASREELIKETRLFRKRYKVDEDSLLLLKLTDTSLTQKKIIDDIEKDEGLKSRMKFMAADLLEKGRCQVYNRWRRKPIRNILVTSYTNSDADGKRFYTFGELTIMDITVASF